MSTVHEQLNFMSGIATANIEKAARIASLTSGSPGSDVFKRQRR